MRTRYTKLNKALGIKIIAQRRQRDMSQAKLGQLLGLTFQQVQKYESGNNAPSLGTLLKLCRIFHLSPNELLDWKSVKNRGDHGPAISSAEKAIAKHGNLAIQLMEVVASLDHREALAVWELHSSRLQNKQQQKPRRSKRRTGNGATTLHT